MAEYQAIEALREIDKRLRACCEEGLTAYEAYDSFYQELVADALTSPTVAVQEEIRSLLWDEHPECCGWPVVGAEYMGQQEMVCYGNPEPALLNDAQIVATLRARFPEPKGDQP